MSENGQNPAIRRLIMQPMWLPVLISITLLSGSMALLTVLIYNGLQRFDPLYEHARQLDALQHQTSLIAQLHSPAMATASAARLDALAARGGWLATNTAGRIRRAAGALQIGLSGRSTALHALREAVGAEVSASLGHFARVHNDARHALQLALTTLVAFPFIVIAFLSGLHGRLVAPLEHMSRVLGRLAARRYEPLEAEGVTPTLRPLFTNYNRLVNRLQILEQAHANRERELETTVAETTRSLMLTQTALVRAERMAAAGEVAASLAHDLRNPLAGIRLALHNLETDHGTTDTAQRLRVVGEEIDRLVGALNAQLARVRHQPEGRRAVNVAEALRSVARLQQLRHAGRCRLQLKMAEELSCDLPETGFRLAVQNLIANACEAVAGHGPGEVSVRAQWQAGELHVRIDDSGPGFPAELIAHGPRAFVSDKVGGTGLGLASARRFAHENHGRLVLANHPRGGACALLALPCEHARR